MVSTRTALEGEALRRIERREYMPDGPQFGSDLPGAEGKYTEVLVDPQWLQAWRLLLDENGEEYGVPVPLPAGQWDQGGPNALMHLRRPDGGFCFSLIEPERKAPKPTIECIYDKCGDAHIGGRRKMLHTMTDLIEHVETFHAREAKVYRKYLDEIMDGLALQNSRLQRLRGLNEQGKAAPKPEGAFYCAADGCTRFFDSEAGRSIHERRDHKEVALDG